MAERPDAQQRQPGNPEPQGSASWGLFEKKLSSGTSLDRHTHAHASLTLVLDGAYDETFAGASHRCARFDVQYKPAGVPHTTCAGPAGVHMFLLRVDADDARVDGVPLPDERGQSSQLYLGRGVPSALAIRLRERVRACGLGGETPGLVERFIGAVRERCLPSDHEMPAWIADARRRLTALDPSSFGLGSLARRLRVHPVHLARVFRRHMGCSVGTHLRRCRIDRAVDALATDDIPLAPLALELGYYDQSHFTHDFRRETGTTPLGLRRAAREVTGPAVGCDSTIPATPHPAV